VSKKRYEIAVIGCGKIWEIGHWKGLQAMPDEAHVRYVYDVDTARARKAAEETGAAFLDDPAPAFKDEAVDIVAILTPPFARVDYVKRACGAGKHLMLEKPMARTLDQALEIVRSIRQAGIRCFIPFMRAVNAARRELAERIQSGTFGEPLVFVHTFLGVPYPWIPLDHWMHDQELSGGPIFDYSIHFLEMARACLGAEAETVVYGGAATTGRVKSDDQATLLVSYEGGKFGEFTKTWNFPPGCDCAHTADHIICRDAVVAMGKTVEVHSPGESRELDLDQGVGHGRTESYCNLIAAIEEDAPLYANELNGLRMNEILDAMERSRASGAREKVALH
jgi:scyllo-inositol 2-dehydrogenase (NAD+)